MKNEIVIKQLQNLFINANDAKLMYAQCADQTKGSELRKFFFETCNKHKEAAEEIANYLEAMGEKKPFLSSSISDNFKRIWLEMKTAFAVNDDKISVESCLNKESDNISAYLDLLAEEGLRNDIKDSLTHHLSWMYEASDYLRTWISNFNHRDTDKINNLNRLLTYNYDAQMVFRQASDTAEDEQLKGVFFSIARAHRLNIQELRQAIRAKGGQPKLGTSIINDYAQVLISMKRLLSSKNDEVLMQETLKCENSSLDAYRTILKDVNLSVSTNELLLDQYENMKDIYLSLKELKNDYVLKEESATS